MGDFIIVYLTVEVKIGSGTNVLTYFSSTCKIERVEWSKIASLGNLTPAGTLYTWPAFIYVADIMFHYAETPSW